MLKGKFCHRTTIKDYKDEDGKDINFGVYGIFNTEKGMWRFFVVSTVTVGKVNPVTRLTPDLCRHDIPATYDNIISYSKEFKTKEEGIEFIQEFKDKWELMTNDTRQELRDKKIGDVLS